MKHEEHEGHEEKQINGGESKFGHGPFNFISLFFVSFVFFVFHAFSSRLRTGLRAFARSAAA